MMSDDYATIRGIVGGLVGARVVDITQHDREDYDPETGSGCFVMLMFDNGAFVKFPIGDEGFEYDDARRD